MTRTKQDCLVYFSMIKVDMFTYIYIYIYIYECVHLVKCFDCPFKSTAKFHCCGPLDFLQWNRGMEPNSTLITVTS